MEAKDGDSTDLVTIGRKLNIQTVLILVGVACSTAITGSGIYYSLSARVTAVETSNSRVWKEVDHHATWLSNLGFKEGVQEPPRGN